VSQVSCLLGGKLLRSPGAGTEDEYMPVRSVLAMPDRLSGLEPFVIGEPDSSPPPPEPLATLVLLTLPLSKLRGKLSRLPLNREEGASARIEALVSRELRRRRLEEDASVSTDALSVRRLFAVAVLYVTGWPCGTR